MTLWYLVCLSMTPMGTFQSRFPAKIPKIRIEYHLETWFLSKKSHINTVCLSRSVTKYRTFWHFHDSFDGAMIAMHLGMSSRLCCKINIDMKSRLNECFIIKWCRIKYSGHIKEECFLLFLNTFHNFMRLIRIWSQFFFINNWKISALWNMLNVYYESVDVVCYFQNISSQLFINVRFFPPDKW